MSKSPSELTLESHLNENISYNVYVTLMFIKSCAKWQKREHGWCTVVEHLFVDILLVSNIKCCNDVMWWNDVMTFWGGLKQGHFIFACLVYIFGYSLCEFTYIVYTHIYIHTVFFVRVSAPQGPPLIWFVVICLQILKKNRKIKIRNIILDDIIIIYISKKKLCGCLFL